MAFARKQAVEAGINADIFIKQIEVESGFNPDAESPVGAIGIAQIVPQWHPGVDPRDPWASLHYAAQLMAGYVAEYGGDYVASLIRYNGGGGAVGAWVLGEPYAESQQYVKLILG